jgi:hypothetical protein
MQIFVLSQGTPPISEPLKNVPKDVNLRLGNAIIAKKK